MGGGGAGVRGGIFVSALRQAGLHRYLHPRGRTLETATESTAKPRGFITYDFLHGLGRRNPRSVLAEIQAVMDRFASPITLDGAGFLLDLAADDNPILNDAYNELCDIYGKEHKVTKGYGRNGRTFRAFQWPLSIESVGDALQFSAGLQNRHPIFGERSGVQVWWVFRFTDPETCIELPGQAALPVLDVRRPTQGSEFALTLKSTAAAALWLFFPFEDASPAFRSYISNFQEALPFRLSTDHWRKWQRDREGQWKPRKLSLQLENAVNRD